MVCERWRFKRSLNYAPILFSSLLFMPILALHKPNDFIFKTKNVKYFRSFVAVFFGTVGLGMEDCLVHRHLWICAALIQQYRGHDTFSHSWEHERLFENETALGGVNMAQDHTLRGSFPPTVIKFHKHIQECEISVHFNSF